MFKTSMPENILDMSLEEVALAVNTSEFEMTVGKKARAKLIQIIYKILGYDLSPDLLYVLLSEPKAQLVLATAGGGKTTLAQVKIILEKIVRKSPITGNKLRGEKILCLVYNKHNVNPMKKKQKQLVAKLYSSGIQGLEIDPDINASTVHSFCEMWKNEYVALCGLLNYKLMMTNECTNLLKSSVKAILMKYGMGETFKVSYNDLLSLYNYLKECMIPMEDLSKVDKFISLKIDEKFLRDVYITYDKMKARKRLYDYTDMLCKVYELLKSNAVVRDRVRNYYDYITADEVQDFTPLMMEIVGLIVSPKTSILCIGDEDQTIYNFRGSDIYNVLNFTDKFEDSVIHVVFTNRRCRKAILDTAVSVIERNTLRFNKKILGNKPDGTVEYIPCTTREGQMLNLVKRLKSINPVELDSTYICYREKNSSLFLSCLLEENNIPFNVLSGYMPFAHEVYGHVIHVLDAMYLPYDGDCHINLYKCLPISKDELYEILKYDPKKHTFTGDNVIRHFKDLDYGKFMSRKSFVEALTILVHVSDAIMSKPMSLFFPDIFDIMKKYYWNWKSSNNDDTVADAFFSDKCFKMFNVDVKYVDFFREYSKRKDYCIRNTTSGYGVTLSTFHKLKGLEAKNVMIVDLDDSIFPNYEQIEQGSYDFNTKISLKEAERRLFYVAITRPLDNLYLYYAQENPSLYVKELLERLSNDAKPKNCEVPSINMEELYNCDMDLEVEQDNDLPAQRLAVADVDISNTSPNSVQNVKMDVFSRGNFIDGVLDKL